VMLDDTDIDSDSERGLKVISRGTAILLLMVYIAYLIFQASRPDMLQRHDG